MHATEENNNQMSFLLQRGSFPIRTSICIRNSTQQNMIERLAATRKSHDIRNDEGDIV